MTDNSNVVIAGKYNVLHCVITDKEDEQYKYIPVDMIPFDNWIDAYKKFVTDSEDYNSDEMLVFITNGTETFSFRDKLEY